MYKKEAIKVTVMLNTPTTASWNFKYLHNIAELNMVPVQIYNLKHE